MLNWVIFPKKKESSEYKADGGSTLGQHWVKSSLVILPSAQLGSGHVVYCRSGDVREVLIFANFARSKNLGIQESRKNHYYNSATKEKKENSRILSFVGSPKIRNSRKFKHAKITRSTVVLTLEALS